MTTDERVQYSGNENARCVHCGLSWDMHIAGMSGQAWCPSEALERHQARSESKSAEMSRAEYVCNAVYTDSANAAATCRDCGWPIIKHSTVRDDVIKGPFKPVEVPTSKQSICSHDVDRTKDNCIYCDRLDSDEIERLHAEARLNREWRERAEHDLAKAWAEIGYLKVQLQDRTAPETACCHPAAESRGEWHDVDCHSQKSPDTLGDCVPLDKRQSVKARACNGCSSNPCVCQEVLDAQKTNACQHDIYKPGSTVEMTSKGDWWRKTCRVCRDSWEHGKPGNGNEG